MQLKRAEAWSLCKPRSRVLEISSGKGRGATHGVRVDRDPLASSSVGEEGSLMLAVNNDVLVVSSGAHFCLEVSEFDL